ncbi:hypothetical protein SCHPADRAFT_947247 [Schizopora paradoxa]|uniref:Uncharacterized protein n=1 Tax=Schizopora paradoxa TaxID=27342 RepID=A0A0H2RJS1_9AGAM|nr:hypothetical protein SCHPADRAFT_947247 [Schizopora paradoxa]
MPLSPTNASVAVSLVESEEQMSLEELVRTGEASRLRRRGAINGGHGRSRSYAYSTGGVDGSSGGDLPWGRVPTQSYYAPPPWAEPTPAPEPVIYPAWSSEADQSKTDEDTEGAGYSLYCGFEEWDFSSSYDEPYELSPFPLPFPSSRASSSKKTVPRRSFIRSTGCGALIHTNGTPRTRDGTWHAKGKASECVVKLDKMYFKHGGLPKQFACGCRWHGVGCAVCGNPLGNVYIPCQAASSPGADASQQQQQQTQSQRRPSRTSSSRTSSSPRTSGSQHHVYTFFCNALTPSPAFDFPERCFSQQPPELPVPPPLSGLSATEYLSPPIRPPDRGARITTAVGAPPAVWSPGLSAFTPSSGSEDADYAYGYGMQEVEVTELDADFDADGALVGLDEPGSPDKPGYELMLWPAR